MEKELHIVIASNTYVLIGFAKQRVNGKIQRSLCEFSVDLVSLIKPNFVPPLFSFLQNDD